MSVELMSCPFCGEIPKKRITSTEVEGHGSYAQRILIKCKCGVSLSKMDREQPERIWNHRTSDPRLEVALAQAVEALEKEKVCQQKRLERFSERLEELKLSHQGNESGLTYWGGFDMGWVKCQVEEITQRIEFITDALAKIKGC